METEGGGVNNRPQKVVLEQKVNSCYGAENQHYDDHLPVEAMDTQDG